MAEKWFDLGRGTEGELLGRAVDFVHRECGPNTRCKFMKFKKHAGRWMAQYTFWVVLDVPDHRQPVFEKIFGWGVYRDSWGMFKATKCHKGKTRCISLGHQYDRDQAVEQIREADKRWSSPST